MTIEQFNGTKWGAPEEEVFIIKFGEGYSTPTF